jgi:hypothetical protein
MAFELSGKIIAVLDQKSGISKTGTSWSVQQYVIETHEQYPKKMCFDVFCEDKISQFNIQIGDELKLFFDVDAREYNGRWYNSFKAWKVEKVNESPLQTIQDISDNDVVFGMPFDSVDEVPPF